jgi:hypothetical protein
LAEDFDPGDWAPDDQDNWPAFNWPANPPGHFYLLRLDDAKGEAADGPMSWTVATVNGRFLPALRIVSEAELAELRLAPRRLTREDVLRHVKRVVDGWALAIYPQTIAPAFSHFDELMAAIGAKQSDVAGEHLRMAINKALRWLSAASVFGLIGLMDDWKKLAPAETDQGLLLFFNEAHRRCYDIALEELRQNMPKYMHRLGRGN